MALKVISITGTKGGVGKTTTSANISAILADMGQRVLLIDTDPQQSLSRYYPIERHADHGLIQMYRSANVSGCISNTSIKNLDIIQNDDPGADNGQIVGFLRQSITHFHNLMMAVSKLGDQYDFVIIDTQGAKGIIQESVILASDILICPVKPGVLDSREFIYGTLDLINKFTPKDGFPSMTGKPAPKVKVLFSMHERTNDAAGIESHFRSEFGEDSKAQISVLSTSIPNLNIYSKAAGQGEPVHRAERQRRGATRPALEIMLSLVRELEPKLVDVLPLQGKLEEVQA